MRVSNGLYGEQDQCYQHVTNKRHHKEHLCESILNRDLWSVRRRSMLLFKEKVYDRSQWVRFFGFAGHKLVVVHNWPGTRLIWITWRLNR